MIRSNINKNEETYTVYLRDKDIELCDSNDFNLEECKNFEIILQTIGLRATPNVTEKLHRAKSLREYGATKFVGMGYTWKFMVESTDMFSIDDDPVGLLTKDLHGIVLAGGQSLSCNGKGINIEFKRDNTDDGNK